MVVWIPLTLNVKIAALTVGYFSLVFSAVVRNSNNYKNDNVNANSMHNSFYSVYDHSRGMHRPATPPPVTSSSSTSRAIYEQNNYIETRRKDSEALFSIGNSGSSFRLKPRQQESGGILIEHQDAHFDPLLVLCLGIHRIPMQLEYNHHQRQEQKAYAHYYQQYYQSQYQENQNQYYQRQYGGGGETNPMEVDQKYTSVNYNGVLNENISFSFQEENGTFFAKMREETFHIPLESYLNSFKPSNGFYEFLSNSKSKQFFCFTEDGEYMIKTMTKDEYTALQDILPAYKNHIDQYPHSLLVRYCGTYRITLTNKGGKPMPSSSFSSTADSYKFDDSSSQEEKEETTTSIIRNSLTSIAASATSTLRSTTTRDSYHFVVMKNILPTNRKYSERYDVKGSMIGRTSNVPPLQTNHPTNKGPGQMADSDIESVDRNRELRSKTILKDHELIAKTKVDPIILSQLYKIDLMTRLCHDVRFLESQHVMDYSLLIGIRNINKEFEIEEENKVLEKQFAAKTFQEMKRATIGDGLINQVRSSVVSLFLGPPNYTALTSKGQRSSHVVIKSNNVYTSDEESLQNLRKGYKIDENEYTQDKITQEHPIWRGGTRIVRQTKPVSNLSSPLFHRLRRRDKNTKSDLSYTQLQVRNKQYFQENRRILGLLDPPDPSRVSHQRRAQEQQQANTKFIYDRNEFLNYDSMEIYNMGIIDILQKYNHRKKAETLLKSTVYNPDLFSCIHPSKYARRFVQFVDNNIMGRK